MNENNIYLLRLHKYNFEKFLPTVMPLLNCYKRTWQAGFLSLQGWEYIWEFEMDRQGMQTALFKNTPGTEQEQPKKFVFIHFYNFEGKEWV